MTGNRLAQDIRLARSRLLAAIEGVSETDLRRKPDPSEWSIIEVVAHLAEVDYHYLGQALAMKDNAGHTFVRFDDERWKMENRDVMRTPITKILANVKQSHQEVVAAAEKMTEDELRRVGRHPRGDYMVREVMERLPAHDENHTSQIRTIRDSLRF